jgi:hypothetical protein
MSLCVKEHEASVYVMKYYVFVAFNIYVLKVNLSCILDSFSHCYLLSYHVNRRAVED